jgi:hypothetical protein
MIRFPEKVETAGDALARLQHSLEATNVLSQDYRSHVLAWAYKAVELADKAAREKARQQGHDEVEKRMRREIFESYAPATELSEEPRKSVKGSVDTPQP